MTNVNGLMHLYNPCKRICTINNYPLLFQVRRQDGMLWSYPKHFAGRIDVVHICRVVVELRTELVKTSAQKAILQIHQQRSTGAKTIYLC